MFFIDARSPYPTPRISQLAALVSLAGLDSRPQPVDQALSLLIVRNDRIELRHGR
jgi:hypothetical protein